MADDKYSDNLCGIQAILKSIEEYDLGLLTRIELYKAIVNHCLTALV